MKKIIFTIINLIIAITATAQSIAGEYLDINNVKARINASGDFFLDFINAQFEVPKGSGVGTIYADALWIGGIDGGGNLKIAANTYRQRGIDFWPGPLDSLAITDSTVIASMNKVWKLKKCEIERYHLWAINGFPGPCPVDSVTENNIISWPGVSPFGEPLAPYLDYNADGIYDATAGDYPSIKGDQAIFFVYNDKGGAHTETGGASIGAEIQTMAYAYDCADSALQNSIFLNYKIINRSAFALYNTYIGKFTDLDIGDFIDDYVGCDVSRGAYFGYNSDSNDVGGYGIFPAAQGVVFLKGPSADSNSVDDPATNSANGSGYGDGTVDNERLGMTKFMYYNNNGDPINGNPANATDFYEYLSGHWKDGTPWTYGGNAIGGSVSCDYIFPGSSDPLGFGTGATLMAAWDEASVGSASNDIRGMASTGPFTFQPGAMQEFEVAYVFGRDYLTLGAVAGVNVMKTRIDTIRAKYSNGIVECCNPASTGIAISTIPQSELELYPNPASSLLFLDYSFDSKSVTIEIFDTRGQIVKQIRMNSSVKQSININDLTPGLYILKLNEGKNIYTQRFIKQ